MPSENIFSFIESLPRDSILALYSDTVRGPYVARTILQRVSSISRPIVLRLVACGGTFPKADVSSWFINSCQNEVHRALQQLERFCVIEPMIHRMKGDPPMNTDDSVILTTSFYTAIHSSLTRVKTTSSPWSPLTVDQLSTLKQKEEENKKNIKDETQQQCPSVDDLESFTQRRWDSVLHYLVGSDDSSFEDPPDAIILFLEQTGLMQDDPENKGESLIITSRGYEFMLYDLHSQVWLFIRQYFERVLSCKKEQYLQSVQEALSFLICLSYCKVGCAYPAAALSKDSRDLMRDFSQFGLVYICKVGGMTLFYPTRVAVNLVLSSLGDKDEDGSIAPSPSLTHSSLSATRALEAALSSPKPSTSHIAIIVQTNFQVVAYTASSLYLSMLGLFCDVDNIRRLPNVIFYRITRDSIKGAFKLGIQAKQILRFLRIHAHPRLRMGDQPLIPSNVVDQIILWDRERNRVSFQEVFSLQLDSENQAEYNAVKKWAIEHECFAWGSETKKKIMVKYESADAVMGFVRTRKKSESK